MVLLEPLQAVL
jgi:hypothetical protein